MTKTYHAPLYVRLANVMTTALLRSGVKLIGFKSYHIYLLTVRGRKSVQPRAVPLALLGRNGKRYVACAGAGDWVLNLRAAGEATLTRGRRSEIVTARELSPEEAALVLREEVKRGYPFARNFGVTAASSLEEFERSVVGHPFFALETM
ncbi:MAG TPA: nitroreductase family deazaflavin-dependent oxidoreductase [Ktedonobacteraceae bacterium]